MWSIEKTEEGQDLVWSQPETGIAPSALKGTANLQNVNIATQPGAVMASYARSKNDQVEAITGGTLTPDGDTLFDAPSTLHGGAWIEVTASTVSGITTTSDPTTATLTYLAVGGGGGGGGATSGATNVEAAGGGGGGGEVLESTASFSVASYAITVGDGGAGGGTGVIPNAEEGENGEDTVIAGIVTANGGGGGGGSKGTNDNGLAGGNGGGGGSDENAATYGTGGTGDQYNGGNANSGATGSGAGGGGAGAAGSDGGSSGTGGDGGDGITSSVSGTSTYYGGGGGGGAGGGVSPTSGNGGQGGGGDGGKTDGNSVPTNPGAGTANTGGGGGGAGTTDSLTMDGADGGSGIAIIAYATGTVWATGGTITYSGGNTIHTFTESGTFTVLAIPGSGRYYVSYEDDTDQIKLSSTYDPYGTNVVTHGTTGSITFNVVGAMSAPVAKATERYYDSSGATQYRYYILDNNSFVWCYDTAVYADTLANNNVGITWTMIDWYDFANTYPIRGIGVVNGWLIMITNNFLLGKPTVKLGPSVDMLLYQGYLSNGLNDVPRFAYSTSQGTLLYTDGNFIGEIFPTTSLITSEANIQSYCSYTASTTTGTVSTIIGGSLPYLTSGTRVPVVFFTAEGGSLPTAITENTVYYIEYDNILDTFEVYTTLVSTTALNLATGASGTQYFNTFYPLGPIAGSNGTAPTLQLTTQRVNLPFYETATRLVEIGNTVLIGCKGNIVYPWNQVDAVPSDVITLPEDDVKTMINVNNTAYIFAGNKGNIYVTNNVVASLTLKIPDYTAGVPGTPNSYIEPTFTWGDADYCRGRVYCSILDQTTTKAGNCGGIWSFIPSENVDPLQAVGTALRLESQNSYGDYDGYAPILITNRQQSGASPKYWAAWQDSYNTASANFGVDYSTENPVGQYIIETDTIPTGTYLAKKTFEQLEYKLAVPMAAGDSVQLYWRIHPTDSWTSAGTVDEESADRISGYYEVNFQKTQWVQIRAVVTTSGNAATSTFVPFKEIRLR